MSGKRGQYDWRGTRTAWRKWKAALKKSTARWSRRQGRKLLEDAPKKATAGWVR